MIVQWTDYNGADSFFAEDRHRAWETLHKALSGAPLFLKESDQKGLQKTLEFDPKGTNSYLKTELVKLAWRANLPIPKEFDFLGKDVDFCLGNVLVEAQFSHYAFLANNVVRAEHFIRNSSTLFKAFVIITREHRLPAGNSTLYYELACKHLKMMSELEISKAPTRVVGLFAKEGQNAATIPQYLARRHSRQSNSHRETTIFLELSKNKFKKPPLPEDS